MNCSPLRSVSFALVLSLAAGFWAPPAARAADDGSAGNMTLGLAVVVAVVTLVAAWHMDFDKTDDMITSTRDLRLDAAGRDDLALVLIDWPSADSDRGEVASGFGLRAWF